MRLGTRITLSTTTLVILALGAHGALSVRARQAELTHDLERQLEQLGSALQVALEAAAVAGERVQIAARLEKQAETVGSAFPDLLEQALAAQDLRHLVAEVRKRESSLDIAFIGTRKGDPAPSDPATRERVRRLQITGTPVGEHVVRQGRAIYAHTVPIRSEREGVVGAVDLQRDASDIEERLIANARGVALTMVLVSLVLGGFVWLTTRRAVTDPLERLVEGIDEVARGDLTRALLRERDDEIGDLADRFNQMTANLREARSETQRGVEARLTLEARLRHSEKLATIGQLAAGIAHEVGTPLNVIGGRARTMEKKANDPAEVAKNADIIATQASRIAKIIQQLLDFARKKVAVRAPLDLAAVVKGAVDFLEPKLEASKVAVRVGAFVREPGEGVPERPWVVGDGDQLQQVCLNLCLNAIQAMAGGGTMEIGVRALCRRKPGLDLAPPGRYVVLEVGDSGVGIPAADRDRIFEPFYSTKQDGGGTGLGLAVSQGIVKDHDGWIEIEGRPQGGTLFRVFLPADDTSAEVPAVAGRES